MPSHAGGPEMKAMIRDTSINGETDATHVLHVVGRPRVFTFLASCVVTKICDR